MAHGAPLPSGGRTTAARFAAEPNPLQGSRPDLTGVWPCKTIAGGLRARVEGTTARPPGHRRARIAALCLTLSVTIMTAPALAQAPQFIDGPLNVYSDGYGRLQFRYDVQPAGLFYPPGSNAANAGLEIVEGGTYYDVESGNGRNTVLAPAAGGAGTRTLTSTYEVGANLRVQETLTYTDGNPFVDASYAIFNRANVATSFRAAVNADLYVGGNDVGTGVIQPTAPRFVGGREPVSGVVSGLQEIGDSQWSAFQEGDYQGVFNAFRDGVFNNAVDFAEVDNGVGVQWNVVDLPGGATRTLNARWLLATAAPPGSILSAPPAAVQTPTPTPTPTPALPPPVAGKSVNLKRASGKVLYKLPGSNKFVALTADVQVPVGTTLDTVNGRVTLTSASDLKGGTNHAWFYEGVFKVGQTKSAKPITELALAGAKPSCKASKSSASAAAKKKTRRLWGDGAGSFRTRGQFSSATVRGTKWVVQDQCNGTLTRVVRGAVTVRDFAKRKTVIVRAGKQYLARPKKK
jgi:hypothetical protein